MNNKKMIAISFLIIVTVSFVFTACGKRDAQKLETQIHIFTKEMRDNLKEVEFWNADNKVSITDSKEMNAIFDLLESLQLTASNTKPKEGYMLIKLITNKEELSIGILDGEICINQKVYMTDKNVLNQIKKIALGK